MLHKLILKNAGMQGLEMVGSEIDYMPANKLCKSSFIYLPTPSERFIYYLFSI